MTENRADDGPAVRVGDAERYEAAHELGEHYAVGRLTADEFRERLARVYGARTDADLEALFADLPAPVAVASVPRARRLPVRTLAAAGLLALGLGTGISVGHAVNGGDRLPGPPGPVFRVPGGHMHPLWMRPGVSGP